MALGIVTQNGAALQWAPAALRADPSIVLKAVQQNGEALQWASAELRGLNWWHASGGITKGGIVQTCLEAHVFAQFCANSGS